MNRVNNVSGNFAETDIDFSQYSVIAVFDEIYGNGGHSIYIIEIVETGDSIYISLDRLLKGNASAVITQPYHIIKMPRTQKKIIFD